jgi:hypothetical protein
MDQIKCVVVGRSHAVCLARASEARAKPSGEMRPRFAYEFVSTIKYEPLPRSKEFISIVAQRLRLCELVLAIFRGNQHNMLGLLQNSDSFSYVEEINGAEPSCKDNILPSSALRHGFVYTLSDLEYFLNWLRSNFAKPVFVMGPPPPIGDEVYIRQHLDAAFLNRLSGSGLSIANAKISPRQFRLGLWRMLNGAYASIANSCAAVWIPPPAEAFDEDGCLTRRAYGKDATHANEWYGELRLQQLESTYMTTRACNA